MRFYVFGEATSELISGIRRKETEMGRCWWVRGGGLGSRPTNNRPIDKTTKITIRSKSLAKIVRLVEMGMAVHATNAPAHTVELALKVPFSNFFMAILEYSKRRSNGNTKESTKYLHFIDMAVVCVVEIVLKNSRRKGICCQRPIVSKAMKVARWVI